MPRNYKRKLGVNPRCNYDPNNLEKAVAAVKSGKLSYRKASDQFGVPRSTIENKVNSTNPGSVGRPSVFDKAEEDMLVHGILRAAHWGFPFTSDDIRYVVKGYLDKCGRKEQRFTQNLPGIEWSRAFLKRHSNVLSVRLSENIKRQRAEVTYDAVQSYFLNIEEAMRNVPPSNIINYDETNLCDDPGRKHVIVRRGTKHPERVIDSSKSSVSVMMAASGAGDLLPPYVLYKSEHLWDTWQEGGPKGTRYNRNKSGWFDLPVFEDWFFTIVLPYFRSKEGPKIMVGDNLSSHISLKVIEECERNNISYILLPPNSTHLLQPLDVGFFKPLKNAWRTVLTEWKQTTRGPISKDAFPSLLKDTLHQISTNKKENIQSAFRAVGLIPFNPDKVLSKLPDKEHGPNNSADAWSASFEEMLKTARYERQGTTNTRRRRKLNVPPGRSISSHDLRNDGHDEPTVGDINLTESLMENRGEMNENEGAYRIVEDETMQQESEITQEEEEDRILEEEAFVLVKYPYWKGNKELNRLFVGIATEVGAKEVNVRFLRPYQNSKSVFIFPEVPDDDSVEKHQIIKVLPVPSEEKGKFIFQGNVL